MTNTNRTANASEASEASAPHGACAHPNACARHGCSGKCAATPSDRAAVDGVTLTKAELDAVLNVFTYDFGAFGTIFSKLTEKDHDELREHIGIALQHAAKRARASDTNAAAAPVGQAIELVRAAYEGLPQYRIGAVSALNDVLSILETGYWQGKKIAPPTPRAAYRQPTIEDAEKLREHFVSLRMVRPARDDEPKVAMLAALKHIGCVIPADRTIPRTPE